MKRVRISLFCVCLLLSTSVFSQLGVCSPDHYESWAKFEYNDDLNRYITVCHQPEKNNHVCCTPISPE